MTKERLRSYRDLKREIKSLKETIEETESTLYSPKVPQMSGMPLTHGTMNPKELAAIKHIELLDYYTKKVSELQKEQLAIETAIEALPYRERTLIRLYYIDGLTWEEVCVKMSYGWTRTHEIHGNALLMLRKE